MKENQNVEFKQIWRDDYLRWICAFANTTGGVLYIGIDDNGKVVGLKNAKELVYEIPHKIKDYLGIVVETSIKHKKKLEYICIKVLAHPSPVSLRGRYYLRSGSNTYEAMGVELDRLLLKRIGVRWEKLSGHTSSLNDLDDDAIEYFKNIAINNGSMSKRESEVDNVTLLNNLRLYSGSELSLAALLLFGKEPEEWVYNSFVKIGRLDNNGNLVQNERVSGTLFVQLDETLKILYSKYLNEDIVPISVMKEILVNAIMHKSYDLYTPIEIRVYDNKVLVWNPASCPKNITKETIYNPHPSIPYNPRIANAFNKCGLASLWGLGIEKIKNDSLLNRTPLPKYNITTDGVEVRCNILKSVRNDLKVMSEREKLIRSIYDSDLISDDELRKVLERKS